jgi:hypothetical protein
MRVTEIAVAALANRSERGVECIAGGSGIAHFYRECGRMERARVAGIVRALVTQLQNHTART